MIFNRSLFKRFYIGLNKLKDIKVQIICVTYNQKDFIKEALDSFLMQNTNFKFEVLVGDDCSTDGTSEIIASYAQKYPNIIKHIKRHSNMGCLANFMDLCESAEAKYVAFCDGDDYWTDANKLQKQFDFMEANEDVNICAHKTKILASADWGLYQDYAKYKEPFVIPNETKKNKKITIKDLMDEHMHTSSLFVRWTISSFPTWAKSGGTVGDMSVIYLLLGNKYCYIMDDIMSIYRRQEQGVFYHGKCRNAHFLNTRLQEYFRILSGTIAYFKENYHSFGVKHIENRLNLEIKHFVQAVIETDQWDKFSLVKEHYPDIYHKIKAWMQEYKYRLKQEDKLGKKRADLLRRTVVLKLIKPILVTINNLEKFGKKMGSGIKKAFAFLAYWLFALVPKKKNSWVFSGFLKTNYIDNTKYLYEYIVKNHPEIEVVWLTKNKEVLKQLRDREFPALKMNSLRGIWAMIRANVAFSDHFRMSDYENRYGFNARTKFVNIFHGFGPKGMRPIGDKIPNTTIPGVRLSSDIFINKGDTFLQKIIKKIKYPFIAPFRELFEEYFGMVCPGTPCNDFFATPWQVRKTAQINCGYPRSVFLYHKNEQINTSKIRILYAPTYRWNVKDERNMVDGLLQNIEKLNELLEKIDGEFVFRMHPHTWRNYEDHILNAIKNFDRFSIDQNKDIYETLNMYSMMITDYSSIGWEFLITKKPVIYYAFDLDTYNQTDCPFDMDYKQICAGKIVTNWQEVVDAIYQYYLNPELEMQRREEIRELFYPSAYNSEENSENLVNIIKEKTKMNS